MSGSTQYSKRKVFVLDEIAGILDFSYNKYALISLHFMPTKLHSSILAYKTAISQTGMSKDDIIRWVEGQLLYFLSDLVQKSAVKFSIEFKTPSLR